LTERLNGLNLVRFCNDIEIRMNNEEETIINDDVTQEDDNQTTPNEEQITNKEETDDISFEDVNDEGEVDARTTIKKLREKIKKLEGEKQEYLDLSQRTRADYVNFKKEVESNQASNRKFATKRFIEELLPVLDSYDMAQGNKEAWEKVDQNWRIGIEYIFNQFRTVLEGEGVTQFGKVGDMFDPNLHESIEMVSVTNEDENGKIVKVLQNGYKMHDSILRPARVHVGHNEKN
jgi:molecular chaperone GrpE